MATGQESTQERATGQEHGTARRAATTPTGGPSSRSRTARNIAVAIGIVASATAGLAACTPSSGSGGTATVSSGS